jgi:hypothetical protein
MQLLAPVFKKETITENQERNSQKMLPCLKGDHFLQEGENPRAWRKGKKFNDVSEDTSRWTSDSFFPKWEKITQEKWVICNKRGLQAGIFTKTSFSGNKSPLKDQQQKFRFVKSRNKFFNRKKRNRNSTQTGNSKLFLQDISTKRLMPRDHKTRQAVF